MGSCSHLTEIKKDNKEKQGEILNTDSYLSDCYWILFLCTALFFGWCGLQFLYAKRIKLFLGGIFLSYFFFLLFSLQETASGIPVVLLVYWLVSVIVPFFVYTDGQGEKMRPFRMLFQKKQQ